MLFYEQSKLFRKSNCLRMKIINRIVCQNAFDILSCNFYTLLVERVYCSLIYFNFISSSLVKGTDCMQFRLRISCSVELAPISVDVTPSCARIHASAVCAIFSPRSSAILLSVCRYCISSGVRRSAVSVLFSDIRESVGISFR